MLLNIYFLFSFFFPTVADREFLFKNMMGIKVKLFHFICSLNARTCKINFVYDVLWDHKIWHRGGGGGGGGGGVLHYIFTYVEYLSYSNI